MGLYLYLDVKGTSGTHCTYMPSYDFVCQDCAKQYEIRVSMSAYAAGEGRQCPECGSTRAERAFTAVNVIGSRSGGQFSGLDSAGPSCGPSGFT